MAVPVPVASFPGEYCSSSDERDSRTHLLSGKALLQIFCDAFDGYNFLIDKFLDPSISLSGKGPSRNGMADQLGPSISLSGRRLSRNGPEDQQVVCSVNAFLCMSYAHEGVWAGADLDADPQPTMEAAEPQYTGSSTGGFSRKQPNRIRLDRPRAGSRTRSSMLSRERRCRWSLRTTGSLTGSSLGRWRPWALRRQ